MSSLPAEAEDCSDLPERTASNPGFDEQNPGTWLPSMLTQLLTMLVQVTLNNLMRTYGALSVYGRRHRSFGLWHDDEGVSDRPFHVCRRLLRRAARSMGITSAQNTSRGCDDLPYGCHDCSWNFCALVPGFLGAPTANRNPVCPGQSPVS